MGAIRLPFDEAVAKAHDLCPKCGSCAHDRRSSRRFAPEYIVGNGPEYLRWMCGCGYSFESDVFMPDEA